jgi:hypothetical protein
VSRGTIRAGLVRSTDTGADPSGKPVAATAKGGVSPAANTSNSASCVALRIAQVFGRSTVRARSPPSQPLRAVVTEASRLAATRFYGGGHGEHRYAVSLTSTGNLGSGTAGYRDYSRDYEIGAEGKPVIHGSPTQPFGETGPAEELLVASLSAVVSRPRCRSWDHRDDHAEGVLEVGRPVQECGAAPDRDRGSGQRRRPGANSPPTRSREVLHRQFGEFSCRV